MSSPVSASVVHHKHTFGGVTLPTIIPQKKVSATPGATAWRDAILALVMAAGLSTVFLSPFHIASTIKSVPTSGRILGEATTVPLHIEVVVSDAAQTKRVTVYPTTGTIAQALGQAAAQLQTSFDYTSRGASIYLADFDALPNAVTGTWTVRVNGAAITDLSQQSLAQGDQLTLDYHSL